MRLINHVLLMSALALAASSAAFGQAADKAAAGVADEIRRLEREYDAAAARSQPICAASA